MPLTIPDQDIAGQFKQTDMLNTLKSIAEIKNSQQSLKTNQLNYQVADTANQKLNQLRDIAANPDMRNSDGSYNQQKYADSIASLGPDSQAAQNSSLGIKGKDIANQTAQLQLQGSQKEAADAQVAGLASNPHFVAAADPNTPPSELSGHVAAMGSALKSSAIAMQRAGVPLDQILERYDASMEHLRSQPQTFAQTLIDTNNQRLSAGGLISANQPSYVDNGQQKFNPNPMIPNAGPIQNQVGPTAQVMNSNGSTQLLGPQALVPTPGPGNQGQNGLDISKLSPASIQFLAKQDPQAFQNGVQHFQQPANSSSPHQAPSLQTGLPSGVEKNLGNNVDEMNRHYGSLQDSSTGAALQLGLTTNIKQLAKGAATGTLAGRTAFVSGLLNSFGIKATGDLQKDTDLLEKNMAQLNMSTPATTNAARELNAAGRPHGTMSESALVEAADQVAGQIKANMSIRNYLTPYKYANNGAGDSQGYQGARQMIEGIADPRAFQFHAASPESQKSMLTNLAPNARMELRNKIEQLSHMGMLK